jgi:1-acyl-sn-glycerol-3-phosphate acyltransferase
MFLLGIIRLILIVITIVGFLFPITFLKPISSHTHIYLKKLLYRVIIAIIGVRIKIHGNFTKRSKPKSTLFISNHSSYLDVMVLGSVIRNLSFTPKKEVRKWPLIGFCAFISDAIFVDRINKRNSIKNNKEILRNILNGKNVHIFPEGTTNNGRELLNFKTSLISVVEESEVNFCSIAIVYKKINWRKIKGDEIDLVAWYGTTSLLPHMIRLFSKLSVEVHLYFKIYDKKHTQLSRKEFTKNARDFIAEKL